MKKQKTVTVRIKEETYERLVKRGNLEDTFDTVIMKLLDSTEGKK